MFIDILLLLLATVVKGDQKAPFSIATTSRWREGATPFPGLLHFTLVTYLIMLSKEVSSTIFKVFGMTLWDWTQVSQTIGEHSTH